MLHLKIYYMLLEYLSSDCCFRTTYSHAKIFASKQTRILQHVYLGTQTHITIAVCMALPCILQISWKICNILQRSNINDCKEKEKNRSLVQSIRFWVLSHICRFVFLISTLDYESHKKKVNNICLFISIFIKRFAFFLNNF